MKRWWLVVPLGLVIGLVGGGVYLFIMKSKTPPVALPNSQVNISSPEIKLITWDDPAGFTFEYPESLAVDKHDEDENNYAHIELTHKDHPGRVIVWGKDLPLGVTDGGSWVAQEKRFAAATIVDTTLGELPAKKVLTAGSTQEVFVGTVQEEVLFYIEAQLDADNFWSTTVDSITRSFAFKIPGAASAAEAGVGEEEAVDEEIVVE